MHGAGSPQAQRIMTSRLDDIKAKQLKAGNSAELSLNPKRAGRGKDKQHTDILITFNFHKGQESLFGADIGNLSALTLVSINYGMC